MEGETHKHKRIHQTVLYSYGLHDQHLLYVYTAQISLVDVTTPYYTWTSLKHNSLL